MSKQEEPLKEEGPRSFAKFLTDLSEGEAESEASYELHELVKRCQEEAVMRQDKAKGRLVLTVNIVADYKGHAVITYSVDTKAPKRRTSTGLFWLTKGGNLTPENPKQTKLPLREVSLARGPAAEDVEDEEPTKAREV